MVMVLYVLYWFMAPVYFSACDNSWFGPWPWCRFLDLILAYDPHVLLPVFVSWIWSLSIPVHGPHAFLSVMIPGFDPWPKCWFLDLITVYPCLWTACILLLWWFLDLIPGGGVDFWIGSLAMVFIPGFVHCLCPHVFLSVRIPGFETWPVAMVLTPQSWTSSLSTGHCLHLQYFPMMISGLIPGHSADSWIWFLDIIPVFACMYSSLWCYLGSIPAHGADSWIWSLPTVYDSQVFFPLIIPGFDPWPLRWFLALIPGHGVDSWIWFSLW